MFSKLLQYLSNLSLLRFRTPFIKFFWNSKTRITSVKQILLRLHNWSTRKYKSALLLLDLPKLTLFIKSFFIFTISFIFPTVLMLLFFYVVSCTLYSIRLNQILRAGSVFNALGWLTPRSNLSTKPLPNSSKNVDINVSKHKTELVIMSQDDLYRLARLQRQAFITARERRAHDDYKKLICLKRILRPELDIYNTLEIRSDNAKLGSLDLWTRLAMRTPRQEYKFNKEEAYRRVGTSDGYSLYDVCMALDISPDDLKRSLMDLEVNNGEKMTLDDSYAGNRDLKQNAFEDYSIKINTGIFTPNTVNYSDSLVCTKILVENGEWPNTLRGTYDFIPYLTTTSDNVDFYISCTKWPNGLVRPGRATIQKQQVRRRSPDDLYQDVRKNMN